MDVGKLPNPFDYANPIRDTSLFAGRQGELSRIFYTVRQVSTAHPTAYLAVTGERAAGKTSLLNIIDILAKRDGRLTVRVDLVPGDDDPVTFFTKLYDELVSALASTGRLETVSGEPITARTVRNIVHGETPTDDFPLEFPESLRYATQGGSLSELALRTDLTYLMKLVDQPIVFLVDEAQELTRSERVLSILRTIGMRLNGYVFILAGTPDLVNQINEVFSPILRQFEIISVHRFTQLRELRNCISHPLSTVGLAPADCFDDLENATQDLMMLTGGSPYELQLFCHVLFARWQAGLTEKMALTPDALDNVLRLLESNQDVRNRPIISAVRRLSNESLAALYLLCSCQGSAKFDEIWFAYNIAVETRFTRDALHGHLESLVADGLIEVRPDECIDFNGDMFDLVYTKVWVRTRSDLLPPNVMLGMPSFRYLLGQRIDVLVKELIPSFMQILEACCPEANPHRMRKAYESLVKPDHSTQFPIMAEYVYCAAIDAGLPDRLAITTITCEYANTKAIRWAFCRTADSYNLNADPQFQAVAQRIGSLGGTLQAEQSSVGPCDWPSLLTWAGTAPIDDRRHIAGHLNSRGYESYGQGDKFKAIEYFGASSRLAASWRAANNQAYILLTTATLDLAAEWARKAIELASDSESRALSRYNLAISSFGSKQYTAAREEVVAAQVDLAKADDKDVRFGYTLAANLTDGKIQLSEARNVKLADVCQTLLDLIEMMGRFPSISPGDDPVI